MPIIRRGQLPADVDGGVRRQFIATAAVGTASLTVMEVTMAPGASLPLHIHPGHEECIIIQQGTFSWVLGDQKGTVGAGNTIIAPSGVKHSLANVGSRPAKLLAIFPTTNVKREAVSS